MIDGSGTDISLYPDTVSGVAIPAGVAGPGEGETVRADSVVDEDAIDASRVL